MAVSQLVTKIVKINKLHIVGKIIDFLVIKALHIFDFIAAHAKCEQHTNLHH